MCLQEKKQFFKVLVQKLRINSEITAAIWLLNRILNKWTLKNVTVLSSLTEERSTTWHFPKMERISLYGCCTQKWTDKETSRENDQKGSVHKKQVAAVKSFFNLPSRKQMFLFSYQRSTWLTHSLQRYCFRGEANLYRLCGLWQVPRRVWTFVLVHKIFQLPGCETQFFQEVWQQSFPIGTKS